MKRKAKQTGSGGRLRLGLLLATAAAFLLVPEVALAAPCLGEVIFAGEGSGSVISHEGPVGEPRIQPATGTGASRNRRRHDLRAVGEPSEPNTKVEEPGICKTELSENLVAPSIRLEHQADPGSVFAGWKVTKDRGSPASRKSPVRETAPSVPSARGSRCPGNVRSQTPSTQALNLTASGAAGGESNARSTAVLPGRVRLKSKKPKRSKYLLPARASNWTNGRPVPVQRRTTTRVRSRWHPKRSAPTPNSLWRPRI